MRQGKIIIVGESGVGKSTLADEMVNFYSQKESAVKFAEEESKLQMSTEFHYGDNVINVWDFGGDKVFLVFFFMWVDVDGDAAEFAFGKFDLFGGF